MTLALACLNAATAPAATAPTGPTHTNEPKPDAVNPAQRPETEYRRPVSRQLHRPHTRTGGSRLSNPKHFHAIENGLDTPGRFFGVSRRFGGEGRAALIA